MNTKTHTSLIKNSLKYAGYMGYTVGTYYGFKYGMKQSNHICFNKENMTKPEIFAEMICYSTITSAYTILGSSTCGAIGFLYPLSLPIGYIYKDFIKEIVLSFDYDNDNEDKSLR